MASRTVAVKVAVEGLNASIAALKQGGAEGQAALERIGVGAAAANQNLARTEQAAGGFSRTIRNLNIQQAGYQINDFAVQVQGGTDKIIAGTQQLSQFAGSFGLVGAAIGGVLGVAGAVYSYFEKLGTSADEAAKQLKTLNEGTEEYRNILEALAPLQAQHLRDIISTGNVAREAAQKQREAAQQAKEGLPLAGLGAEGVGMGPLAGAKPAATQQDAINQLIRARVQAYKTEYDAIDKYIQEREEQRIKKYGVNTPKGGIEGFQGAQQAGMDQGAAIELQRQKAEQAKQDAADKRAETARASAKKAAEALAVTNARLLEQAKLATQAAQAETEALTMGEDARKRANVEREYELKLLAAAQPAQKAIQLALIDEANARRQAELATIAQSRAIEDAQKKIDASPDAAGGGGLGFHGMTEGQAEANRRELEALGKKNAKRAGEDQEDAMTTAWKNIAENVDTITTKMFDEMLDKGKLSFKDLADGISDMMRTTISSAMGDIVSAPIKQFAQQMSTGQVGGMMPNWGGAAGSAGATDYATAVGGGAAGGYVVGSVYAQAAGKQDTYAATGGAVGGAAGAAIGTAIAPGAGTVVGGMLGSMAGSFIGGMFGGEGLGNDQSVQKFGAKAAKAIWSDKSFSEENRTVTGGIIGQLGQLSEALRATGANINDVQIAISAGNKTGIQVGGKGFGTDADAAAAAAIRILLQNTGGLQGSQVTALQTTKGRNAQEVMQDLAFAKEFDKITFSGTVAEAAMRDLQEQFDATARKAHELGLDETALGAARERAMAQLTLAAQRQQRDLAATFQSAVATDPVQKSVIGLNQQFAQLADTFTDAGYSAEQLAQLESARAANEQQIYAQVAAQRQAEAEAAAAQQRAEAEARRQQAIQEAEARKQLQRQQRDSYAQVLTTVTKDPLQQQIIGINQQFAQLRDTMQDLGYAASSYKDVEKARRRAIAEATEADRRQKRDFDVEYRNAISSSELEVTLRNIGLQFTQLSESLKDAGYSSASLAAVEQARTRAQDEAIKQAQRQVQDLQKDMESRVLAIGSFYDQLIQPLQAVNQNNMLNPAGQIGAARQAFQADLAGAGARDPEAIRRLGGSAQAFQGLVQQNYGTAGVGGQYLREIQGGVGGEIANLQQERAAALADLPQVVQKTTLDIIRENRADIDRVVEQLELLRRDLRSRGIAA